MTPDHDFWRQDAERWDAAPCPACGGRGCGACRHTGRLEPEAARALERRRAEAADLETS